MIESIFAAALLALAATGIMKIQSKVFTNQTVSRDQLVGMELVQACAERVLWTRRNSGYASVTNTLCNGLGGLGGFNANPSVVLKDAANATVTTCAITSATCTATITIAKTTGPAVPSGLVTLRLSYY